jgi:SAM-dependent methyltransferase
MATASTSTGERGPAEVEARAEVANEYAELAAFFDAFAPDEARWRRRTATYHRLVSQVAGFYVPPGRRVLEVGSGSGDLLAALRPSYGVGVDISDGMSSLARSRHPDLRFETVAGEALDLGETFDYIVLSDLVAYAHDLIALLERAAAHSHSRTRLVISSHSRLWRPVIRLAEALRLKPRKPIRNWVAPEDVLNLLELCGFEAVALSRRVLMPKQVPLLTFLLNGIVANIWPLNHLCLTYWIVARPRGVPTGEQSVSVICPCRNEEGNVASLIERLPALGSATELVFVEGGSTDGTRDEIERQIAAHAELDLRLVEQPGMGKGDAVRAGFAAAKNDVLMILDGDLSVAPEDLPKFYRALVEGRGELVNGSRLVYDVEPGSMRFLNMIGNKLFSRLFKAITGQFVKDTLCGTKVLARADYERIAAERSYFGDFDPFGDFDLLFGGARLSMRIVDLPVRYRPRTYGKTNISRWRHGWLLLTMTLFALWKFRAALFLRRAA